MRLAIHGSYTTFLMEYEFKIKLCQISKIHYFKILRNNRYSPNKALEGKFWEAEYTFMVFDAKLANGGFGSEALF